MKRRLIYICSPLVLFTMFIALCGKVHSLGKLFLVKESDFQSNSSGYRYGDLYRFSHVSNFKELIKNKIPTSRNYSLNECEILLIGDSFFESYIGEDKFSTLLEDKINKKVFDISSLNGTYMSKPLEFFKDINFQKDKKKILILEVVERYSIERILNSYFSANSKIKNIVKNLRDETNDLFVPDDLNFFFENNIIIEPIINLKSDFNFEVFGQIDDLTPRYSLNPPMLFYKEEIEFNNEIRTENNIEEITNNLLKLRTIFKDKYNLDLIFVIIPDKYSVYCDLVSDNYNNFIPGLVEKLKDKNFEIPDIYSEMISARRDNPKELLYYMSDTHYNSKGRDIVLDECARLVNLQLEK